MTTSRFSVSVMTGLLPIIAINGTYLVAASEGHVPWCIPYWEGCTSISATGREGSAFFLFKLTMLPLGLLYITYWSQACAGLLTLGLNGRTILLPGVAGAVAMMLYTIVLGAVGDAFQLTRRIGIILFFTLTYLAQLLTVYELGKYQPELPGRRLQFRLCELILVIGLISLVLGLVLENYDDFEDSFEWGLALLLHLNFIVSHWTWKDLKQKLAL